MIFFTTFLEGIITFISPCMLPMIPMYISFFSGKKENQNKTTLENAVAFVLGFTIIFVAAGGILAATIGAFLSDYKRLISIISGIIMILFGLNYMGILNIKFLNRVVKVDYRPKEDAGFFSSLLFGVIFSIGWSPCIGAFLGSALMKAGQTGQVVQGSLLLLAFSLGLGIPFIITAVLINQLKTVFDFIKKHYKIINFISGIFLIITGLLMVVGLLDKILNTLSARFI